MSSVEVVLKDEAVASFDDGAGFAVTEEGLLEVWADPKAWGSGTRPMAVVAPGQWIYAYVESKES